MATDANADLFEINPSDPYTQSDLDWNNTNSRSSVEMRDPNSRPNIRSRVKNMEKHSQVFVGFPIWWYTAPKIIHTFLESYDFSHKTIILFATSGGSEFGNTIATLRPLCARDTKWREGKVFKGMVSNDTLKKWLKDI